MIAHEQFVLEPLEDGGVLLDLGSGLLFQINRTASLVWQKALVGMDREQIARALMAIFEVSESVARRDVDVALALPTKRDFPVPATEFRYEQLDRGYQVLSNGVPALEVSKSGQTLRALSSLSPERADYCLRAVTPKFVALLGISVLHASAVASPDGTVIAFLGESGAGKTTTARAFAAIGRGWKAVCEDKLVLRIHAGRPVAVLGGEKHIMTWVAEAREKVTTKSGTYDDAGSLVGAVEGPALPLKQVFLLARDRREGESIRLKSLGQTEAAKEIFHFGSFGSGASAEWRRQINLTALVAKTVQVFLATMPQGLMNLDEGARRYIDSMAS